MAVSMMENRGGVLSVTQQLTQPGKAWFCTVISAFGIVILGVLGLLFKSGSESMVGSINDPKDGAA